MGMLGRTVVCAAVLLLLAGSGQAADPLHVWVGFTGVQTQAVKVLPMQLQGRPQAGTMRYINVVVGSNEPTSPPPPPHWVHTALLVTGPGNFTCQVEHTATTVLRPAVTTPLRFEVLYPSPTPRRNPRGGPVLGQPAPVQYTLKASVRVADPGSATGENTFTFQFPGGGTPRCRKLG